MTQYSLIMSHPEVYILVSVHISDLRSSGFLDVERIGRKVTNVMANSTGHNFFGSLKKLFRLWSPSAIVLQNSVFHFSLLDLADFFLPADIGYCIPAACQSSS